MYNSLKTVVRTSTGLVILMIGIIGIFLPFLPGWILIFVAIPFISPEYGRKMAVKVKSWFKKGDHRLNERN